MLQCNFIKVARGKKAQWGGILFLSIWQGSLHLNSSPHCKNAPLVAAPADLSHPPRHFSSSLCLCANRCHLETQFYWVLHLSTWTSENIRCQQIIPNSTNQKVTAGNRTMKHRSKYSDPKMYHTTLVTCTAEYFPNHYTQRIKLDRQTDTYKLLFTHQSFYLLTNFESL